MKTLSIFKVALEESKTTDLWHIAGFIKLFKQTCPLDCAPPGSDEILFNHQKSIFIYLYVLS